MEFLERGEPHWPVRANIRWEITVSPDSDGDVTVDNRQPGLRR